MFAEGFSDLNGKGTRYLFVSYSYVRQTVSNLPHDMPSSAKQIISFIWRAVKG